MKRFFIVTSLLAFAACGPAVTPRLEMGRQHFNGDSIVGGVLVKETDPVTKHIMSVAQVQSQQTVGNLIYTNFSTCTGVLIGPRTILTAAHCFHGKGDVYVNTGLVSDVGDPGVKAAKFVIHPSYDSSESNESSLTEHRDIALVFLASPFGKDMEPIKISQEPLLKGVPLLVAGYGQQVHTGQPLTPEQDSGVLKQVVRPAIKVNGMGPSEFAIEQTETEGVGHGDSGGPVMMQKGSMLELVGITARSVTWEGEGFPRLMAFGKAAAFLDWINAEKKIFSESLNAAPPAAPSAGNQ